MLELAKHKSKFERREVPKAEAVAYFTEKADPYKLELIDGLEDGNITFYSQGSFTDLCRGPHLPDTSAIKAAKIMNVAGAYWRGDEKNKQLTRLYGITFPRPRTSPSTSKSSRRPSAATTASWVRSWSCSPSPRRWARACPCGCPRVRPCAKTWSSSCAKLR